jgi:hypothetical protein
MAALLPLVLCGGGMLVCFLLMSRMHGHTTSADETGAVHDGADVARLRQEVDALRAELRIRQEGPHAGPKATST